MSDKTDTHDIVIDPTGEIRRFKRTEVSVISDKKLGAVSVKVGWGVCPWAIPSSGDGMSVSTFVTHQ